MSSLAGNPRLDALVKGFKDTFAANPALLTNGQFQISDVLVGDIATRVRLELAAILPNADLEKAFAAWQDDDTNPARAADILTIIRRDGLEAWVPQTFRIFSADPRAADVVSTTFGATWSGSGIPAPVAVAAPSAAKVAAAFKREASACFETTGALGRKYRTAMARKAPTDPALFQSGQLANARLVTRPTRQEIVHDAPALGAAMAKVGAALDAGVVYRAGVMSGANHTNVGKTFPDPEHWLLLFGRDGDAFLFWDSDAATTNIATFPGWGPGIGVLFFRDNRFSTAIDTADFFAISDSAHVAETERHCYQVYNLSPFF